jgi:predicted Rossmann-fold nucleotide-binding protein
MLHGGGSTPEAATKAALNIDGVVYRIVVAKDAPDTSPGGKCTLVIRPSNLQCLEAILAHADAIIALPGDLKTMALILQIWSFGAEETERFRPIVLLGERWPGMIKALVDAAGLEPRDEMMLSYASSPEEAVETLRYYAAPAPAT